MRRPVFSHGHMYVEFLNYLNAKIKSENKESLCDIEINVDWEELNPISKALFRGTTGLAGRMNVFLKGYGFI